MPSYTGPEGWSEPRETRKQLRRFLVIGGSSVLVDLGVYAVLTRLGMSVHAAKGISYVAGMLLGFVGNKLWTFECRSTSMAEPVLYCLLYLVTLAVNIGVNAAVLGVAGRFIPAPYAAGFAWLSATGVTTILNFLGMRYVAFRSGLQDRREAAPGTFFQKEAA